MRTTLALAALLFVACDDGRSVADAGPGDAGDPDIGGLFVDIRYTTQCPDGHCSGPAEREICGVSGGSRCTALDGAVTASCSATGTFDDGRRISFAATQGLGFEIEVIDMATGIQDDEGCTVRLTEGSAVYDGACGRDGPSVDQPCQILGVAFYDDSGNPTFEGRVECEGLRGDAGALDVPSGLFRVANCDGIEL